MYLTGKTDLIFIDHEVMLKSGILILPDVVKLVYQVICGNFCACRIYRGGLDLFPGNYGADATGL